MTIVEIRILSVELLPSPAIPLLGILSQHIAEMPAHIRASDHCHIEA